MANCCHRKPLPAQCDNGWQLTSAGLCEECPLNAGCALFNDNTCDCVDCNQGYDFLTNCLAVSFCGCGYLHAQPLVEWPKASSAPDGVADSAGLRLTFIAVSIRALSNKPRPLYAVRQWLGAAC